MESKTANKGEWSEIYTLFKLLSEGRLFGADSDLNKLENVYYPILKIVYPSNSTNEFHIDSKIKLIRGSDQFLLEEIPIEKFTELASQTLKKIKESKKTFSIPELNEIFLKLEITKIKADSTSKADITLIVHDVYTGFIPTLHFSIKSKLGGNSSLLNSSQSTNFTYNIIGIVDQNKVDEFNKVQVKDKIRILKKENVILQFENVENEVFNNNLKLIDSLLPNIIAECLLIYYSGQSKKINEIVKILENNNPLQFPHGLNFYNYKIKKFLTASALGMLSSKPWNGKFVASGGYLIVRSDGEVLCYHLYNFNEFEDYLLNNTYLDTPSTGRHHFGSLYSDNKSNMKIKLNLQIRFINEQR